MLKRPLFGQKLVIGNSEYLDPRLAPLASPSEDVVQLEQVLRAKDIGEFDEVSVLINRTEAELRRAINRFFANRKRDDLVLFYFSGHGVLDDQGALYLAVKDTEHDALTATAIPSGFLKQEMNRSDSRRQVLLLDCCYSGAFSRTKSAVGTSVGTAIAFDPQGYGRIILAATDATQYAWDNDQIPAGQASISLFTHYLIEGLRTGSADFNNDGLITTDELYEFVYEQVVKATPRQNPVKITEKQMGALVIARCAKDHTQDVIPVIAPIRGLDVEMPAQRTTQNRNIFTVEDGSAFPILTPADVNWPLPHFDQILAPTPPSVTWNEDDLREYVFVVETSLSALGTPARVVQINQGPTVTQFGVEPGFVSVNGQSVRVAISSIKALENDLAAVLGTDVHIEAPIPRRALVGIEIINRDRSFIALREMLTPILTNPSRNAMRVGLGKGAIDGNLITDRLVDMRHIFIAGTMSSGKSNFVRACIACLLFQQNPDSLKLLMIDTRYTGLIDFNGLPHLLTSVATESERALTLLEEVLHEMEERYTKLSETQVRDIISYNAVAAANENKRMPRLVIDEISDIVEADPEGADFILTRLAELSHVVGIHLVVTTRTPLADLVARLQNAYFPTRVALSLNSAEESCTVVKQPGAEKLLKRGDIICCVRTCLQIQFEFRRPMQRMSRFNDW